MHSPSTTSLKKPLPEHEISIEDPHSAERDVNAHSRSSNSRVPNYSRASVKNKAKQSELAIFITLIDYILLINSECFNHAALLVSSQLEVTF